MLKAAVIVLACAGVVAADEPPWRCRADLDGSGNLDFFDYLEFQRLYALQDPRADLNGDGELTIADLWFLGELFWWGCR